MKSPDENREVMRFQQELADIVPDPTKVTQMYAQYQEKYNAWERHKNALRNRLKNLLDPIRSVGCVFRQIDVRVKEFPSMIRSAYKESMAEYTGADFDFRSATEAVKDLIGARVTGLTLRDVVKIVRRIRSAPDFKWSESKIKDFYEQAKESGYRSWQVQLQWPDPIWARKENEYKPLECRWIEIQVRTILDDAWAEWDHELFYKRPPGATVGAWQRFCLNLQPMAKEFARSTDEMSRQFDRMRDTISSIYIPLPDSVTSHVGNFEGFSPSEEFVSCFASKFGTELITCNLTKGLALSQVSIDWQPERFVGFQIPQPSRQDAKRFSFRELAEKDLELQLLLPDTDIQKLLTDRRFASAARQLLKLCYKKRKSTAYRTFFNEYQARVYTTPQFDKNSPFQTSRLRLTLGKTNFAYEVCTTYVLDEQRTIVPDKKHQNLEDREVDGAKQRLKEILTSIGSDNVRKYSANPLAVHVNLISIKRGDRNAKSTGEAQLLVMRRGRECALGQHQWGTSVSGVMAPIHESIESGGDIPGLLYEEHDCKRRHCIPSVFRAAQRELEEELAVHVPIDHIIVIGCLTDIQTNQPLVFAEAYTDKGYDEIEANRGLAEEGWEVNRVWPVPLNERGLRYLFSEPKVEPSSKLMDRRVKLPKPTMIPSTANKSGDEVWQARSAVAVLLTFCRYLGSQKIENRLRA